MINQINIIEGLERQVEETEDSIQDLLTHAKTILFTMFEDPEHWTKTVENRQRYDDYIHYHYVKNKHEYDVWPASVTISQDVNYRRYAFKIKEMEIHAIHHALDSSNTEYEELRSKFDSDAFVNAFECVMAYVANQEKIKTLKKHLVERKTIATQFAQALGLNSDTKTSVPIPLVKDESVIPAQGTIVVRDGEVYQSDGCQWLHVGSVAHTDNDDSDDDDDWALSIHDTLNKTITPPSSWEKFKQKFKK